MLKIIADIKELLMVKRISDILDLILAEQKKRQQEASDYISAHINDADFVFPKLYQRQFHSGYYPDERSFIRTRINMGRSNEEIVKTMMEYFDKCIDEAIQLYEIANKHGG